MGGGGFNIIYTKMMKNYQCAASYVISKILIKKMNSNMIKEVPMGEGVLIVYNILMW